MPPADSAQSSPPNTCPNDSCAESNNQETSSRIELANESGIYSFAEIETCPDHSGSNEESPRPSLQSTADMYSWSLNDVSSVMNERKAKDSDSQRDLAHARASAAEIPAIDTIRFATPLADENPTYASLGGNA
ncbi:hypothetical protein MY10362_001997 [Beauveria mimosiformis]